MIADTRSTAEAMDGARTCKDNGSKVGNARTHHHARRTAFNYQGSGYSCFAFLAGGSLLEQNEYSQLND